MAGTATHTCDASLDADALYLPPQLDVLPTAADNHALYFWLTALAAHADPAAPLPADTAGWLAHNHRQTAQVLARLPGLATRYATLVTALKAGAGMGAYGAAKAGVHALTQALAEELKTTNVTVNAVLPSIIDTPTNRKDMPDADPTAWVAPADLAAVILFLASPESRAMTGALVPVTGRV